MKASDAGKMVHDRRYDALCSAMRDMMRSAEKVFAMHPTEIAGCLGSLVGEYIACEDDHILHDEKTMELVMQDCKEKGIEGVPNPCLDTYTANFKYAYEEHLKSHKKIRDSFTEANKMLDRVCESHKKE
jgi:hypothetical protein